MRRDTCYDPWTKWGCAFEPDRPRVRCPSPPSCRETHWAISFQQFEIASLDFTFSALQCFVWFRSFRRARGRLLRTTPGHATARAPCYPTGGCRCSSCFRSSRRARRVIHTFDIDRIVISGAVRFQRAAGRRLDLSWRPRMRTRRGHRRPHHANKCAGALPAGVCLRRF